MPLTKNDHKINENKKNKQVDNLNEMIGIMLMDSAVDKAKLEDLQMFAGDLLMEIAILKGEM